jgi:hypothetical protein
MDILLSLVCLALLVAPPVLRSRGYGGRALWFALSVGAFLLAPLLLPLCLHRHHECTSREEWLPIFVGALAVGSLFAGVIRGPQKT